MREFDYIQKDTSFTSGDCFKTCVAYLLGINPDIVPNFCAMEGDWIQHLQAWLEPRGLMYLELDCDKNDMLDCHALIDGTLCILTGHSPRNPEKFHCIIGKYVLKDNEQQMKYIHDPHPDGTWITDFKHYAFIMRRL